MRNSMHTPEEINKSDYPKTESQTPLETREDRTCSPGRQDKKVNKIGITYHQVSNANTPHVKGRVTALDHWLINQVLDTVGRPELKIIAWNGKTVYGKHTQNSPVVTLCDRTSLLHLIVDPEMNFGDLYSSGRIKFEGDLSGFLIDTFAKMSDYGTGNKLRRVIKGALHHTIGNTLNRSKDNIYHHYDLSNDFYKKWLDTEAMQYTCAYFPKDDMTLEQAQTAKLHHICRKLQLKPGDTVIEAGCGWGGLARFMAMHYGVTVNAYNISREQIAFAQNKAQEMGLSDKVTYVEDDYRNIKGEYDVFVSVGMLEHVGTDNFKTLGDVINRCLKADGRGLIHSISRNQPGQMSTWIERRIFPGGYAPALSEMMDLFENHDFSVWDVENLRLHYARTLEHWLQRFEEHEGEIADMFDESFVRAWRLYLCGSIASFVSGTNCLFQVLFARGNCNDVPASRTYMYAIEPPVKFDGQV